MKRYLCGECNCYVKELFYEDKQRLKKLCVDCFIDRNKIVLQCDKCGSFDDILRIDGMYPEFLCIDCATDLMGVDE